MTSSHARRTLGLCLALVVGAGCGSSPNAPGGLDVAGNWTGTWQFVTSGVTVTDQVTVTFAQTNGTAAGAWTAASGASGRMVFSVAAAVTGTVTISQVTVSGMICSAGGALSGTVSQSVMSLATPSFPSTGGCQWATNHEFILHR